MAMTVDSCSAAGSGAARSTGTFLSTINQRRRPPKAVTSAAPTTRRTALMRHRAQPVEHLASLPPMPPPAPTMLRLNDAGAVIDLPVPVLRRDAYCWAATMWPDPAQPSGWGRARWWDVQMGRPGYQPVALEYADLIEFGADLPTRTGRHATWLPVRWYGIGCATTL
jgi:hypothetical protein